MISSKSGGVCAIGFAYFEAYVPDLKGLPTSGTEIFVPQLELSVGGAFNFALVAATLGARSTLACPIGAGLADAAVRRRLEAAPHLHVLSWSCAPDPAISLVFSHSDDRAFVSKAAFEALKDCPRIEGFDWVHAAGLPEADALRDKLEAAANEGSRVSLSASWHPELLRKLAERNDKFWDVVFLNNLEAEHLAPGEALEQFAGCAKSVVITRGPLGVEALVNGRRCTQPARPAAAKNFTGAGDAFSAGFVCAQLAGGGAEQALEWGACAAARYISLNSNQRLALDKPQRAEFLNL